MTGARNSAIGLTVLALCVVISIALFSGDPSRTPELAERRGDGGADSESLEAVPLDGGRQVAGEHESRPGSLAQDGTAPRVGDALAPIFGGTEVTSRVTLEELLGDPSNAFLVERGLQILHGVYSDVLDEIEEQYPSIETLSFSREAAAEMSMNGGLALTLRRPDLEARRIHVPCPPDYSEQVRELQSAVLLLANSEAYVSHITLLAGRSLPDDVDALRLTVQPVLGGREFIICDEQGNEVRRVHHSVPAYVR